MAISYNWTCTACSATNAAGTDHCGKCGADAVISASEIEARANGHLGATVVSSTSPPLGKAKRFILYCCIVAMVVGVLLERVSIPPMFIWYLGWGLMAVGGLPLCVMVAVQKRQ